MKIAVLMENEPLAPGFRAAHGLSLYLETPEHRLLFDAGPDGGFAANAAALGVDLGAVDTAVLSHGHSDHGDGLSAFFAENAAAPVYVQKGAFGRYDVVRPEGTAYIGVAPAVQAHGDRFVWVDGERVIDDELRIFRPREDALRADTGARLKMERDGELLPDVFDHEQDLLVTCEGKAVVLAGCAHRGIVNIVRRAAQLLGRAPDAVVGGFHLKDLDLSSPAAQKLVDDIAAALLEGETVYYTGHCTGAPAFERLAAAMGPRLRRFRAGTVFEI